MAGLIQTIAKRLMGSLDSKKSSSGIRVPSTATRPAGKNTEQQPIRIKTVAPTVGPDIPMSYSEQTSDVMDKSIEITSEEENTMDNINTEVQMQDVSAAYAEAINRINAREDEYMDEEKDDYLLSQIDEFREKAQKLQSLLLTKESKVMELQSIVDEKEGKAKELELILDERQKKADGITEEVSKQIESLIDKVTSKMEQIGVSLGQELQDGQKLGGQQIEDLKNTLASLNSQQMEELKETLGSMSVQQAEELKNALDSLNSQLEVVKSELSDKVHSENVKCFRNVSDLLKIVDRYVEAGMSAKDAIKKTAQEYGVSKNEIYRNYVS